MSNKFMNTEELMEHLKKQIVQYSNGEEIAFENNSNARTTTDDLDLTLLKQEVERNNLLWNVSAERPITSHRKKSGKFIVFGKKIVRKFLRWYIETPFKAQAEFNGSVTRSLNEATNLLVVAKNTIDQLMASHHDLLNKVNLIEGTLGEQNNNILSYKNEMHTGSEYLNTKYENLKSEFQYLKNDLERLSDNGETFSDINQKIKTIQVELDNVGVTVYEQKDALKNFVFPKLDEINGRIHYNEQQLRSELNFINYRIRKTIKGSLSVEEISSMDSDSNLKQTETLMEETQFDYLLFENRFRGTNEDIRNRQMKYLPYFENKQNVLDIGCGRGEFLELLLSNNISVKGIDITDEMVEYCQDLGLPVVNQEAINYLQLQKDNSIGGIFLGQVIEHIPFDSIIKLVELAWKKLMPGSYLIMETPNPQTLAIFNRSFYMDPTHVKPVHPLTVQFLTESVGFRESHIVYSGRVEKEMAMPHVKASEDVILNLEEINNSIDRLNDLLFGDQDYALIARK
ncbi:class I SAM-dependent methyltransferase [Paenibacillus sp. FSL K6-2862]|uniref:class I SAM-dependent methyltransferase n=1 Tax=Paenibacillus sp. FSL K6-2862 TaxID=2921484 RepID=UPI0030FBBA6C